MGCWWDEIWMSMDFSVINLGLAISDQDECALFNEKKMREAMGITVGLLSRGKYPQRNG
jgi:hypothetical protein